MEETVTAPSVTREIASWESMVQNQSSQMLPAPKKSVNITGLPIKIKFLGISMLQNVN